MNLRKFFIGRAIGTIILFSIIGIIAGFYALNDYIYKEKQGDGKISQLENKSKASTFIWKYEEADSLNLDGIPNTNIFLEVKYENGIIQNKLIDTTAGSCNDLPDIKEDSVPNSTIAQCYSAGLGYRFKVVKGESSYLVMRKKFEEALPDYTPPSYEYEVVSEFPLAI